MVDVRAISLTEQRMREQLPVMREKRETHKKNVRAFYLHLYVQRVKQFISFELYFLKQESVKKINLFISRFKQ